MKPNGLMLKAGVVNFLAALAFFAPASGADVALDPACGVWTCWDDLTCEDKEESERICEGICPGYYTLACRDDSGCDPYTALLCIPPPP
jgi:hypothetical protein